MNKNTNICNNCGKQGHMFNQCKLPIISYGIIVFRSSQEGIQFIRNFFADSDKDEEEYLADTQLLSAFDISANLK